MRQASFAAHSEPGSLLLSLISARVHSHPIVRSMARIGELGPFKPKQDWDVYLERFTIFCSANRVKDTDKVASFLAVIGAMAYKRIRALCAPDLPSTRTFDQIVALLCPAARPKVTRMTARYKFHNRRQAAGESLTDFDIALRECAVDCHFANLQEALCDRFVLGLHDIDIQRELLNKDVDLTYDVALQTALTREAVSNEYKQLRDLTLNVSGSQGETAHDSGNVSQPAEVHHVKYSKHGTAGQRQHYVAGSKRQMSKHVFGKCKHCGRRNHRSEDCHFRNAVCHVCKVRGHIKPVCRKAKAGKNIYSLSANADDGHSVDSASTESDGYPCHTFSVNNVHNTVVQAAATKPFLIDVKVQNRKIRMELDTGSAVTVISKSEFDKFGICRLIRPVTTILKTHTQEEIQPLGVTTVRVEYQDQTRILEMYVVNHNGPTLFGRSWLRSLKLDWQAIHSVATVSAANEGDTKHKLQEMLKKFESLFRPGIGQLKGYKAKLHMKPGGCPKFFKHRPMPYSIGEKVSEDIDRLVHGCILSPVSHSEWATPIVPICKRDGSVRICGDFKVTVNPHSYDIQHRPAAQHKNVDGLSRIPLKTGSDRISSDESEIAVFNVSQISPLPVTAREIAKETRKDPLLSKVYLYTQNGWDNCSDVSTGIKPYYSRKDALTITDGVLMYGTRVVVPAKFQSRVLEVLHETHLGIVKTKALARSYVYWPLIDQQIEQHVKSCDSCALVAKNPALAPLHPWEYPSRVWS